MDYTAVRIQSTPQSWSKKGQKLYLKKSHDVKMYVRVMITTSMKK